GTSGWVDEDDRPLVVISQLPVQGKNRGNQVQLHPFGNQEHTNVTFDIANNPYTSLTTAYALADDAIGKSNGVEYYIYVSTDGGKKYNNLMQVDVTQNIWERSTIDLSTYVNQDLKFKIISSSRGNTEYDWLQVTIDLISALNLE
ncbi:unnamed protein product, partial [marine sediment metagenome]